MTPTEPTEEKKMSDDEMRIAVAEACGWRCVHLQPEFDGPQLRGMPPKSNIRDAIPDYLGDLNACHGFEILLDVPTHKFSDGVNGSLSLFDKYCYELACRTGRSIRADPLQRCETFLRVIGKWREPV